MQLVLSSFLFSEDLEEEAKKSSKWLDDDEEGACGFAIGRRIFEKAEIEVTKKNIFNHQRY